MPPDHWRPLPAEVPGWSIEFRFQGTKARTVALPLREHGLVVWNPGLPVPEEARLELRDLGGVEYLLSPNFFHYMGIRSWLGSVGEVPVVATERARGRLERKLDMAGKLRVVAELEPRLADGFELVPAPGSRTGECWVCYRRGDAQAWIVGDSFFNITELPWSAIGIVIRLLGAGPGLRLSHGFKWGALESRQAYRDWIVDRLERAPPTILVPAHGDCIEGALEERLRELARRRLS